MMVFAANRCIQLSIEITARNVLVTTWAWKAYKSSIPVRYIPGSYTQGKERQKSSPLQSAKLKQAGLLGNILSKGRRVTSTRQNSGSCDGSLSKVSVARTIPNANEFSDVFRYDGEFSESEDATEPVAHLMDSEFMGDSEHLINISPNSNNNRTVESETTCSSRTTQDAENVAIELLATRAFTAVELRKKLHGKKYPLGVIDSLIADLQGRGLLNDGLFAESYSRSRWLSASWGPRRIKRALVQKGVSESDAEKATKQVFEDSDTADENPVRGMSKLSIERLIVQVSKQWLRGQDRPVENRNAKIVRWLQYRGFDWGVINFILRRLKSQYPP